MKLYTQEQVNEIMVLLQQSFLPENIECDGAYCMGCWKDVVRETLKKMVNLTPIELPSYEEAAERLYPIKNTGSMFMPNLDDVNNIYKKEGFMEGAKWVINHIKQQDNEQ